MNNEVKESLDFIDANANTIKNILVVYKTTHPEYATMMKELLVVLEEPINNILSNVIDLHELLGTNKEDLND